MFLGLRTVIYPNPDLAAGRAFFSALLGRPPSFDQLFYVGFDVGGFELGLVPDGAPSDAGAQGYWGVPDVAAAVERAEALGSRVLEAPHGVGDGIVVAAVTDPAGNRVGLIDHPGFVAELGGRAAATGAEASDLAVVRRFAVAAPIARVWRAWTRREDLGWLAPDGRVELRIGGPYELWFRPDAPPGQRGGEGNRVLAFLAPRMLAVTWNAPPELPTREARTQVLLELSPRADGGTDGVLTHSGWPAAGLADEASGWPETFRYFERAWGQVTGALERHLGRP